MSEQKKVLVIDRQQWCRGGNQSNSALLTLNGTMCCLGFDAIACGIPEEAIFEVGYPDSIPTKYMLPQFYVQTRMDGCKLSGGGRNKAHPTYRAALINDNPNITDEEREAQLIPLLKQLGWDDVQFVN